MIYSFRKAVLKKSRKKKFFIRCPKVMRAGTGNHTFCGLTLPTFVNTSIDCIAIVLDFVSIFVLLLLIFQRVQGYLGECQSRKILLAERKSAMEIVKNIVRKTVTKMKIGQGNSNLVHILYLFPICIKLLNIRCVQIESML